MNFEIRVKCRLEVEDIKFDITIIISMKNFKLLILISHFKFVIIKPYKFNLEIRMSTSKSKSKLL